MIETKEKVISQIRKLNEVKFKQPSAMNLHGSRPLMNRVQRQENRLYKQRVEKQKKDYKVKLTRINKYLLDLQTEEARRLDLLNSYDSTLLATAPLYPTPLYPTPLYQVPVSSAPVFQPIDVVVPKPIIGIPGMPLQGRNRIHSRRRAKNLRRLR